jgi:hypothetical protein
MKRQFGAGIGKDAPTREMEMKLDLLVVESLLASTLHS